MSTTAETFQISPAAAELYESQFVPGIFAEWAPRLVRFAGIDAGQRVLDVACGTGIFARVAADVVGNDGAVVGLDLNPAMLDVARRVRPDIDWQEGQAEDLPFADGTFDVTVCQMALMFFPDRPRAIAEMARVARERVAVLVPAAIEDQPAYRLFTDVVVEHAGEEGASLVGTYWSAGDLDALTALLTGAGLHEVESQCVTGTAAFESIEALVATEVEGSPLIDRIDEPTYARIREGCRRVLDGFTTSSGAIEAPLRCHLVRGLVAEA